MAVNVALVETVAEIPEATIDINGSLNVSATGSHTARTEATAGAQGGVAVAPAVALSVVANRTVASVNSIDVDEDVSGQAELQYQGD